MKTFAKSVILFLSGFILFAMMIVLAIPAQANDVIQRVGNKCPAGYMRDGNSSYCKSLGSNRTSIIRSGSGCPSGHIKNGKYCTRDNSHTGTSSAISRKGSKCPHNYHSNGRYCERN